MSTRTLTLFQKALILVAVPLTFELALLGTVTGLLVQADKEAKQAAHAKAVIAKTNEVVQLLFDLGYAYVAYDASTNAISGKHFEEVLQRAPVELRALETLVQHEPEHQALVQRVALEAAANFRLLKDRKDAIARGGHLDVMEAFNLRQTLNELVAKLDKLIKDERAQEGDQDVAEKLNGLVKFALLGGVLTSILLAALLVVRFHQSTTSRLKVLIDNSAKIGFGSELGEVLNGNDEIAKIDRVLHEAAEALAEFQRKERAVIDNAVDVICTIDAAGKYATVSPASRKLWGYAPNELIGRNWHEIISVNDVDRSLNWAKSMRQMPDTPLENQVRCADGRFADMRWSGHWSNSDQSLFCVAHDMSERLEVERFKQQFVSMISHDLRTPLSAVKSTLELLGAGALGALSEKGQTKVLKAEDNLRHTMDLINNLLDLEKMESGRMDLELKACQLQPILNRCVDAVSALAERDSKKIVSQNTEAVVLVDDRRLSQLLINLLGNAIKFSPANSSIFIAVEMIGLMVRVSITDQGPGMPAEQLPLVFDKYHQTKTEETKLIEGTGLGLAICKAIAEAHHGTIGVESVEGHGCTFWFSVPKA